MSPVAGSYVQTRSLSRRVAGFAPAGMLDWPGRVAATIFVGGCSFRCPFCHNPSLLSPPTEPLDVRALLACLRSNDGWLDGVVVTGGEPTEDPSLAVLLRQLADEGLPVRLDTNGSRPDVLEQVIGQGLVSSIAMDVKTVPERYDALVRRPGAAKTIERSIMVIRRSGVDHEFRTTAYPGAVVTSDLPRIAESLAGGHRYVIQQFRPDVTLDPRAAGVSPHGPYALREAAQLCSAHLPTSLRGA